MEPEFASTVARRALERLVALGLPFVLFLAAWQLAVEGNEQRQFFFASPALVGKAIYLDVTRGSLALDVVVTALESATGFIIGCAVGTVLGLALWLSARAARVLRPYVIAVGSIPIFAVAPMMIIWFGTGIGSKVMMAALSTVVIAVTQAYEGARNVDADLITLVRTFGAQKRHIYAKVIVPASMVWVLASYKLNVGFALLGAFVGEFISSENGLGHYILKAGGLYDVPRVLGGAACIAVLSLLMTGAVGVLERRVLPWRHVATAPEAPLSVQT